MPKKSGLTIPVLIPTLKLSLVLPRSNRATIDAIIHLLDRVIPRNYELIIPEDLTRQYSHLKTIPPSANFSLADTIIRGWQVAQGNILGVIPANMQPPPEILLQLLQEIERGADLAVGNLTPRRLSPLAKNLGLLIVPEIINRLSDPLSDYFLVRREAITQHKFTPIDTQILLEIMGKGKIYKIAEINYVCPQAKSDLNYQEYFNYFQHLIRLRFSISSRFIQFCIVGIGGVIVDMTVLFIFSDPNWFNLPIILSKSLSAEAGVIHNFLWNDAWTFRDVAKQQPGIIPKLKRLLKFNFVCLTGLVISVIVLYILYNYLRFGNFSGGKYIANLMAIAVVTFWNFWLHSKLSWRVSHGK